MSFQNPKEWNYGLPGALLLLAPFNILASLGMDIYLPVVPAMPEILGTTPSVIQLTLSIYMIVLGVGQMAFGPVSDRIGRRPVLIAAAIVFAASSFLLAAVSTAPLFLALRLLQAIGAAGCMVALFATVRDVYADRPESATVYGLLSGMLAFVPALGPIIGALIADAVGWRGIFVALGLAATVMLVVALLKWRETRPEQIPGKRTGFLPVLRSLAFWTYTLGFSAAMGAFFVFFSTAPRVLIGGAGYSEFWFSIAFATAALVMIVATPFAKRITGSLGVWGSMAASMLLIILGAGLLCAGQLFYQPSFWSFVLPMWVVSVGIVLASSVAANGALAAFSDMAGTAVALYFCIESLIVGVVGTLFVILLDADTAWPLAAYSAAMATLTLVALVLLRQNETVSVS